MDKALITLNLTDIAYGGDAIGRYEGKVIFVPYAIPGERVRVRPEEAKKSYARARLEEVLSPSPHRVETPCPYFGACGGCQWQHIDYSAQLLYKCEIIKSQFRRIGKLDDPPVRPMLGMANPWHYRNHAQFAISAEGGLGFRIGRSHRVIPIDTCLLLHPLLNETLGMLDLDFSGLTRVSIRVGIRTGDVLIVLESGAKEVPEVTVNVPVSCVLLAQDGTEITLVGKRYIHERVAKRTYRVSVGSFFQINTDQTERLIQILGEGLALGADDRLLDAYCGVGTLGLSLASRVAQVIGIESHSGAMEDALINAGGLSNTYFIEGKVEEILPDMIDSIDVVILDPPRQGCHPAVIRALCARGPQRIAYVSCDPTTLARDVHLLVENGGYYLHEVQPLDMFPQTYHIESVSFLMRN